MKAAITILTTLFYLTILGQTKTNTLVVFKETNFNFAGQISDIKEKSLQVEGILDLAFYRNNFSRPNHFPETFLNKKFKNQTIEIWSDTTKPKDIKSNWAYTYFYDSLSRVTLYSYSSCLICGQQAYNIQITYDTRNRPITFSVRHSFDKKFPESEKYQFTYDNENNVIQLKYFSGVRLEKQIDKI